MTQRMDLRGNHCLGSSKGLILQGFDLERHRPSGLRVAAPADQLPSDPKKVIQPFVGLDHFFIKNKGIPSITIHRI